MEIIIIIVIYKIMIIFRDIDTFLFNFILLSNYENIFLPIKTFSFNNY